MPQSALSNEQLQALVDNLNAHAPKAPFTVMGSSYPVSKIVSLAASVLQSRAAVSTAKGDWKNARVADAKVEAEIIPILVVVRGYLVGMLGNNAAAMATVGVAPRKRPPPLTVEQKVVANAKRAATRTARGTQGKKQKAKVTGNVTGVSMTPVTTPSPSTTPSVSSTNGGVVEPTMPSMPTLPDGTATIAGPAAAPGTAGH
jgi:hypothetical protein